MKAYIFAAALLCETCGSKTADQLRESTKQLHPEFDENNESTFDSDYFPKGPYDNGGGEADCPQHCDHCGIFLENPLTQHGVEYVQDALDENSGNDSLKEWAEFYEMTPRCWYHSSCGRITLRILFDDAESGSHQGQCDDDIAALRDVPYIKQQLESLNAQDVARELSEYGAWDATELADHEENLSRLLWIACGNIVEEATMKEEN